MGIPNGRITSLSCEWPSPEGVVKALAEEFGPFGLDVCASEANSKGRDRIGPENLWGGLNAQWRGLVWMNPPYGRTIGAWVQKAYESAQAGAMVVCLLPARTDTRWWHDYCMRGEIRFIRGRLKFGGAKGSAPFPSVVVVFRPPMLNGA